MNKDKKIINSEAFTYKRKVSQAKHRKNLPGTEGPNEL